MLAESDFSTATFAVLVVFSIGAAGGFYWCRKQSSK